MARHGNSHYTPHLNNLMNCEKICKMLMKATLDGDVYNRLSYAVDNETFSRKRVRRKIFEHQEFQVQLFL